MLLGKVQSGKTRTFIGIVALAFDNGYDVAIILTKGTRALAQQTLERLTSEFSGFIESDKVQVYDIMLLPNNLALFELSQKLIFVVKKETNNLNRLLSAFEKDYPSLMDRKVLIIDDEADYASIGFKHSKNEGTKMNTIARQIDSLRSRIKSVSFLQVTATPYSLYLQPDSIEIENEVFKPVKPAFTELVPIHSNYIGGEYYFVESEDEDSIASLIYQEVSDAELIVLKKEDRRRFKIEEVLVSDRIISLRNSIVNFIVGAVVRRLQDEYVNVTPSKYSFIVHTETKKECHDWQVRIIEELNRKLLIAAHHEESVLRQLVDKSYESMTSSIEMINGYKPEIDSVYKAVQAALIEGQLLVTKVNSENDINQLLDKNGQLKLRTPLNVFVGGQILDRGITIGNLIGFFYGRHPSRFQQDTVLQHSRMFGFRPKNDLAVTRFYTSPDIYDAMANIQKIDAALRRDFELSKSSGGVVFIQKDDRNRVVPCSPNKILLSSTTTLRPNRRMLPFGFQTKSDAKVTKIVENINNKILSFQIDGDEMSPFLLKISLAIEIVGDIYKTFEFDKGHEWDVKAFVACMEYLSKSSSDPSRVGYVWCLVRRNRDIKRERISGRFSNSPDTPQREGVIARDYAKDIPVLMLFQQNGKKEDGWRGVPFWWPVLMSPSNMRTVLFASEVAG